MEAIGAGPPSIHALRAGQILCALTHLLQFVFLYGQQDYEVCSSNPNTYMSSTLIDDVFGLSPRFVQERESLRWHLAVGYIGLNPSETPETYILENESSLEPILRPSECSNLKEVLKTNGRRIAIADIVEDRIVHIDFNIDLLQELSSERRDWEREGAGQGYRTPLLPGIRTGPELQDKYSTFLRDLVSPQRPQPQDAEERSCPRRFPNPIKGLDIPRYIGGRRGSISFDTFYDMLSEHSIYLKWDRDFSRERDPHQLLQKELEEVNSMLNGYKTYQPLTALPEGVSNFTSTDQDEKVAEMVADVLFQLNDMRRGSYLRRAYLSLNHLSHEHICSQVFIKKSGWEFFFQKLPKYLPGSNRGEWTGSAWALVRCMPLRLPPRGIETLEEPEIYCWCFQSRY
jgi:hypothetical protein